MCDRVRDQPGNATDDWALARPGVGMGRLGTGMKMTWPH